MEILVATFCVIGVVATIGFAVAFGLAIYKANK